VAFHACGAYGHILGTVRALVDRASLAHIAIQHVAFHACGACGHFLGTVSAMLNRANHHNLVCRIVHSPICGSGFFQFAMFITVDRQKRSTPIGNTRPICACQRVWPRVEATCLFVMSLKIDIRWGFVVGIRLRRLTCLRLIGTEFSTDFPRGSGIN